MVQQALETGATYSVHVLQAESGQPLIVPGESWLLKADFAPQGPDLLLTGPDGRQVLVRDFFDLDTPPDLMTVAGGVISGELATRLAGPVASGQIALLDNGAFMEVAQESEAIGRVEATDGTVEAIRIDGSKVTLKQGDEIFQGDTLVTGKGAAIGITFADDTTFSLGEEGRMVIDEMVYDPETQEGAFSANLVQGVFSFVSGQIAKTGPDAMTVTTPVATIGIRGTKVAGRAAQEGANNTISLLPETDAQGNQSVGELAVTNQGGTVTLNAVGATVQMTSAFAQPPAPVVFSQEQIQQNFGATLTTLTETASLKAANDAQETAEKAEQAEAEAEQAAEEAEAAAEEAEAAAEEAEAEQAAAEEALAEAEAAGDEEAIAEAEAALADAEAKAEAAEAMAEEADAKAEAAEEAAAEAEAAGAEAEAAETQAEHAAQEMAAQLQAFAAFANAFGGDEGDEEDEGPDEDEPDEADDEGADEGGDEGPDEGGDEDFDGPEDGEEGEEAFGDEGPGDEDGPDAADDGPGDMGDAGPADGGDVFGGGDMFGGGALFGGGDMFMGGDLFGDGGLFGDEGPLDGEGMLGDAGLFEDMMVDMVEEIFDFLMPEAEEAFEDILEQSGLLNEEEIMAITDGGLTDSRENLLDIGGTGDSRAAKLNVGYYDMSAGAGVAAQEASITAAGHTAVKMSDLTADELSGIDVLMVQNPSNGGYGSEFISALDDIKDAVSNGLVMFVHDRYVTKAGDYYAGDDTPSFTRSTGKDITVLDTTTVLAEGPGGRVDNSTLDGGNSSHHGYITEDLLPAASTSLFSTGESDQIVDFVLAQGEGGIVYSSIPLDYYLSQSTPSGVALNMTDIYAPNAVQFAASLILDGYATLTGTDDGETISGTSNGETITAGDGNDTVYGLYGNDVIKGEDGDDTLIGGSGEDTLTGGDGNDTFTYTTVADSKFGWLDHITDFTAGGSGDKIDTNIAGTLRVIANQSTDTALSDFNLSTLNELSNATDGSLGTLLSGDGENTEVMQLTTSNDKVLWAIDVDASGNFDTSDTIIEVTGLSGDINASDFV